MTTRFLDGWDYLPSADPARTNMLLADGYWGSLGIVPDTGRFGIGQSVRITDPPGGTNLQRSLGWVFDGGFVWGVALKHASDHFTMRLRNSQTETEVFRIEFPGTAGAGVIRFISSFGTTRTRTGAYNAGTWFYLQMKWVGTTFEVKINGDTVVHVEGAGACPTFDTLQLTNDFGSGNFYLDDMYMNDPTDGSTNIDYLGNIVVRTQVPTAVGDQTDLTPFGGGTNWQIAANPALDTARYNYTPDVGDGDLYGMNPNVAARDVLAVQVKGYYMQDNGVQLYGANQIKVDSTVTEGTPRGLNSGNYGAITDYWDRNPNDGSVWTQADLNAPIQAGPKLQASD